MSIGAPILKSKIAPKKDIHDKIYDYSPQPYRMPLTIGTGPTTSSTEKNKENN